MSEQKETPATNAVSEEPRHENGGTEAVIDAPVNEAVGEEEPPVVIRMRSNLADMNGQQASLNGHAAVQRGLDALADVETSQNVEEIKKLDTQLDHFNKYLDKFEQKNSELTERLSNLLKTQKEERLKRRASFMQREEELKVEQESFDGQLANMFAKCAQMRRTSAPAAGNGVENALEHSRRIREGPNETPIREMNGHDEAKTAGN